MQPLDIVLSGEDVAIAGRVWEGAFYQCRDGRIVGPMIDDGREPSFGYAAALGGDTRETWYSEGWSALGDRSRDLVREVRPPFMWSGGAWVKLLAVAYPETQKGPAAGLNRAAEPFEQARSIHERPRPIMPVNFHPHVSSD